MNLLQASEFHTRITIEAGGPGSGRHSEGGRQEKPAHDKNHSRLTKAGFSHMSTINYGKGKGYLEKHPTQTISTYKHPKLGTVTTDGNGDWEHYQKGTRVDGVPTDYGAHRELPSFIKSLK